MRRCLSVGFSSLWFIALAVPSIRAQFEPPSTGGMVALAHELRMLGHYKRVLMIGAHPDDEDTELLTVLVRGLGAEAAYLSLNRGEGGQNLIGQELGVALGVLRSEELLAARAVDGARQYFTRAYDFGYSKTIDETWRQWPRDTILKDVVRIVRRFRPQIIVSIFSGTAADGHGQHQAAGWAAHEAFRVAGDSSRFPELLIEEGLRPWAPRKLYRSARFDSAAATLVLESGRLDPATGRSYHQAAMAGRSLHRSQDMGRLQRIGPAPVRLALVGRDSAAIRAAGDVPDALFTGIDTTLEAMPWSGPNGAEVRARLVARADSARRMAGVATLGQLAALLQRAEDDLLVPKRDSIARLVLMAPEQAAQLRHVSRARAIAAGTVVDALANDDRLVPGQTVIAEASVWNAGDSVPQAIVPSVPPPADWTAARDTARGAASVPAGALLTRTVELDVAADASLTTPYYLRRPLRGAMYDWSRVSAPLLGEPFEPPPLTAAFDGPVFGARVEREVVFRFNDQGQGEVRQPLVIVPRIGVRLEPAVAVWSTGALGSRQFTVTLKHGARDTTSGVVRLILPRGWGTAEPRRFRLTREDEERMFVFDVQPPAGTAPGSATVRAIAEDSSGRTYELGVVRIDYPHVRARIYTEPATAAVTVAPVTLPALSKVGYVRGASDLVPEMLRDVGVPVVMLDAGALRQGDLSQYDAIVIGARAYEVDSALNANNGRLLEYARRGGLLIVQYQQHRFFRGRFAPYPLVVGAPGVSHDRVTDETAAVRVLAPNHPAVTTPNRIGPADWRGWVQERGLYFAHSWDEAYRPVLEMQDPEDVPLQGGLLIASIERGTYVYTGLSFFRQLPAGVPGAFRLFANLLALARRTP